MHVVTCACISISIKVGIINTIAGATVAVLDWLESRLPQTLAILLGIF
jgi:hypothetical protein